MSGNQILINLEFPENLRPSELCGALIELSKRPGSESTIYLILAWTYKKYSK